MAAPPTTQLPAFLSQTRAQLHAKFVDLEWQQRNRLLQGTQSPTSPTDPPSPWSRLTGDAISARNRYLNVEPYAHNRVKLKMAGAANDYINASPIVLGKRRYIATQGPKDTNVNHFYRMLAQECSGPGPAVVVMLTQTHEAGREKCFQYYPLSAEESPLVIPDEDEDGDENEGHVAGDHFHGEVELQSVEVDGSSRSEVRSMRLRTRTSTEGGMSENETLKQEKEIRHLLFSGWPDFLIPEGEDRQALIQLVHLSNTLNQAPSTNGSASATNHDSQSNPRIIHCSAGVGRSGTFIALDYLLSLLYAGELYHLAEVDMDPIAETVDLLRQQRMMMVQGEAQFNFLYEVLREMWEARGGGGSQA
ncbi:tyrosine protein phosphatase 1 [Friedmanniomyces endolithicus]|uniref:Tyrosine protein phosphatase 1 n=1 Tax=Friedmanniomyces endolithicus TaxID=329885 RepID=A0AAN6HE85_9PEZI|nr:tyrosine protein phosphatase 1 [Friedmanniomyces endolithicus]KAK0775868.1 tyrosine protein phosphatase 1 [Friedmanniomyces endolithicus]KAK0813452.1 tyrosine protein phosphatase 1 [Friedmanniomyces endolithicus]KAK0821434.1 tyrosine protein phosphatase 1 [Friedmanniomyces endolithicus]KAK0851919.1 tyrosine protein phosphatase 1 [Friedmanniomyces endolithicus]